MPIDRGFEYRFSEHEWRTVRESVATLSKIIPIDVTLSTTDTAQDLITLESNTPPTMNLVTNPSMETGDPPTNWTSVSSTLSQVTTTPRTGTKSMQVVTSNSVANEGAYFSVTGLPRGWYACSAYFRRTGGGTAQVRASSDDGVTFSDGNVVTMANNWNNRSSVLHHVTTPNATLRLYVVTDTQQNITYLVEDAQVEPAWSMVMGGSTNARDPNPPVAAITAFVDPASERFSRWLGTADASVSLREPSISEIHDMYLYTTAQDVYIDFNRTVKTSSPAGFLLKGGIDYAINLRHIVKHNISFINATATQTPRVIGYVRGM